MRKSIFLTTIISIIVVNSYCNNEKGYNNVRPKNLILMIGDGMGLGQIQAAMTANKGKLYFLNFPVSGFQKTASANNYITDSAASSTAMATGSKTKNGYVGVDRYKKPLKTILELAEENGLSTGLVSTSSIVHATPACFIAHQPNRNWLEKIAKDFLETDIDVFIGGGLNYFTKRKDGLDLTLVLRKNGYGLYTSLDNIDSEKHNKLAVLTAPIHNKKMSEGRGNMLGKATEKALEVLSKNEKGFFLMIEGSQIDWGGHDNDEDYVIDELIDFDNVVKQVHDFAKKNGETLIIVTADHETGGMVVLDGNYESGKVKCVFTHTYHTGTMVPVFTNGPGATEFSGVYENTDIFFKMKKLLKL